MKIDVNWLKKYHIHITKSLGQNFLNDPNILEKIAQAGQINENELIIEIGPGTGNLTQFLADKAEKIIGIEIDKQLIPLLNERFENHPNVFILHKDILKMDMEAVLTENQPFENYKVIANLPYYITTAIIMKFLQLQKAPSMMILMMQKEVADRICASVGTKAYGSLTVAVQYFCTPKKLFQVSPHCFIPQPDVSSTVIQLKQHTKPPVELKDQALFFSLLKAAFAQRRKMAINSIAHNMKIPRMDVENLFLQSNIPIKKRAEQIDMEGFARLENHLYDHLQNQD